MYMSSTQLLNALTRALVQTKRPKFKKQFIVDNTQSFLKIKVDNISLCT